MDEFTIEGKKYVALIKEMGTLPLIVVKAKKGYIACSYIDKDTAEKVGDIAAFVSGLKDLKDLEKAKIRAATSWAEDLGIREGMSVKKALELMDESSAQLVAARIFAFSRSLRSFNPETKAAISPTFSAVSLSI
jgi:uncharacterized protein YunC (DUF1805 family)